MKPEYLFMNVVAPAFILLPIIIALLRYNALSCTGRAIFYYLLVNLVVCIISSALALLHSPNLFLYHFSTIAETLMLLNFFRLVFYKKQFSKYIRWLMLIFPLLALLNTLFLQHINQFNSYALSLQSILIIGLCFLYWWKQQDDEGHAWASLPLNWIISGLLLYFSSAFILFTFSHMIVSLASRTTSIIIWNVHAGLSVLMLLFISIGFRKYAPHEQ